MITLCLSLMAHARNGREYDVVVYGGSPAAISAAVQVKRMGLECVIVCPDKRIGGLTTGGLGQTDIGNKNAFGGIALEFYRDIAAWYRGQRRICLQRRRRAGRSRRERRAPASVSDRLRFNRAETRRMR